MMIVKEIAFLLRKEILLEWRQKYAISGILLYVLSTVFVVYTSFKKVDPNVWNTLFWIIILFASVNAIAKSFVQENSNRQLYYYTLTNPSAIILSKVIYNSGLLIFLSVLTFAVFSLVAGNPVKDNFQFFTALFLGSIGFSITFTFISAISAKANNSSTLMAILSFPIIIPIILTLIKLSANALRLMQDSAVWKDIATLLAIDLILISMTFILFPFLWRD
jgi:heme exporter protein B